MGIIVGRWLKHGKKKVWDTRFETAVGAKRAANITAENLAKYDKTSVYTIGTPFRHGAYWNIYVHAEKVERY